MFQCSERRFPSAVQWHSGTETQWHGAVREDFPVRWRLTNVLSPPLFTPLMPISASLVIHTHIIDYNEEHKDI